MRILQYIKVTLYDNIILCSKLEMELIFTKYENVDYVLSKDE